MACIARWRLNVWRDLFADVSWSQSESINDQHSSQQGENSCRLLTYSSMLRLPRRRLPVAALLAILAARAALKNRQQTGLGQPYVACLLRPGWWRLRSICWEQGASSLLLSYGRACIHLFNILLAVPLCAMTASTFLPTWREGRAAGAAISFLLSSFKLSPVPVTCPPHACLEPI